MLTAHVVVNPSQQTLLEETQKLITRLDADSISLIEGEIRKRKTFLERQNNISEIIKAAGIILTNEARHNKHIGDVSSILFKQYGICSDIYYTVNLKSENNRSLIVLDFLVNPEEVQEGQALLRRNPVTGHMTVDFSIILESDDEHSECSLKVILRYTDETGNHRSLKMNGNSIIDYIIHPATRQQLEYFGVQMLLNMFVPGVLLLRHKT